MIGSVALVSRWQLVGCLVSVVGLMVVASSIGLFLGRRRGRGPSPSRDEAGAP